MHYYKRHIGDYAKKAGKLTMLQHGAYTLLIDACYDRERFPTKEQALHWAWASTPEEEEAVKFVLARFFEKQDDGSYTQARVSDEVENYRKICEQNGLIARARETVRERSVNEASPNHKPLTTIHKPETKETKERKKTVAIAPLPPFGVSPIV